MDQNFPNPFSASGGSALGANPATIITFVLPEESPVTLKMYDLLGRELLTLVHEKKEVGVHAVYLDASAFQSGIYLYRLVAGPFVETKKMVLLR